MSVAFWNRFKQKKKKKEPHPISSALVATLAGVRVSARARVRSHGQGRAILGAGLKCSACGKVAIASAVNRGLLPMRGTIRGRHTSYSEPLHKSANRSRMLAEEQDLALALLTALD